VEISLPAACSPGIYPIDGEGNTVRMVTFDCPGIPDAFEGAYSANSGYVRVDELDAGTTPGFLAGMPITTRFNGYVTVQSAEGLDRVLRDR
jgi:hypothetical protein